MAWRGGAAKPQFSSDIGISFKHHCIFSDRTIQINARKAFGPAAMKSKTCTVTRC